MKQRPARLSRRAARREVKMSFGSVLVLYPNKAQAHNVASMLTRHKWTSVLSFDQTTALRILKGSKFRLLLFEAYVNGSSTMQSIDKIREVSEGAPLAIMTDGGAGGQAVRSTLDLAKNSGADFTIARPFTEERLKVLLTETNAFHRAHATERHILVIEDHPDMRRQLCTVLKQVGYNVSAAANMEDAFFDHNLGGIDAVLTSILIPGIGGIEGISQMRRDFPHLRIIAMSEGVDDKITAVHVLAAAKAAGADALLPKPFHMPEMLRAVESVVVKPKVDPEAEGNSAAQDAIDAIFAR
ncbi:MAG: response regulator [Asticcacaulis sp.]